MEPREPAGASPRGHAAAQRLRTGLRNSAERLLCGLGISAGARLLHRGAVLVLAYHNIVPEGEPAGGDVSLHLPQREFARQLDRVARTHDVVPLASVLGPSRSGRRPRAAITFDDAYCGALAGGVEELARRGLPATFFVSPGLLGGRSFWWDALAAADGSGLAPAVRRHALESLAGRDDAVRAWAAAERLPQIEPVPHQRTATEPELARALSLPGMAAASHSWSHPNLTRLGPGQLRLQLERPLAWLRERFEGVLPWLSYPYGLGSPDVAAMAEDAGYVAAMRINGRWLDPRSSGQGAFALPRVNIPAGLSLHGFDLRTAGLRGG